MKNDTTLGTVVWITGAGTGIGRALALQLAADGCAVAASGRKTASLNALVTEASPLIGSVTSFPLDVTDAVQQEKCVKMIETALGPIDLVICNAGTHRSAGAATFSSEAFQQLLDVNLMGAVHGLAAILPRFINRRRGRIAIMSSVAGYRGLPSAAAYGATKAALINMAEALKPDLERYGISISIICPGFVKTPLTDQNTFPMPFLMDADAAAKRILRALRRGRFEISFPRRLTFWIKLSRLLPNAVFFWFTRKMVRQRD